MAVPSNRTPSPLSSRPNSTIRRSFSGSPFPRPSVLTNPRSFNPVTPANSPAGFGGRNSVGKEGMGQFQSCDEKENEKDQILKPVKVLRSPAATNGSKNFMSPTISAASKFTPSPKKKPLVERNEPIRTSISLLDGKATFFSTISSENSEDLVPKSDDVGLDSTVIQLDKNEAVFEGPPASKDAKKVTFAKLPSDSEKKEDENIDPGCLNVESNILSPSPIIAPLDADPSSISSYDPKTNYLSPRPQFLHYKPNPRIEVLLHNKEKGLDSEDVRKLEDSFVLESSSETFSDSDGEDSQKDSEDSSSTETEEPEVKEDQFPISSETKGKWRFLKSLKSFSLLLVFLVSVITISVTNSPYMDSTTLKTLNFAELNLPSGVVDMFKANFDAFAGKFHQQLSFGSFSHLSMLIKHDPLIHLQFMNLTDLQKDILVEGYLQASELVPPISPCLNEVTENVKLVTGGNFENEDLEEDEEEEDGESYDVEGVSDYDSSEPESDGGIDLGTQELESTPEQQVSQVEKTESLETVWNKEEAVSDLDIQSEEKTTEIQPELLETMKSECAIIDLAPDALEVKSDESTTATQLELLETEILEAPIVLSSEAKVESISDVTKFSDDHNSHSESAIDGSQNLLSANIIAGVTVVVVLCLISTAVFVYSRLRSTSNKNAPVYRDQLLTKTIPSSQNWTTEEVDDVMGESCPSELSSFQTVSSHSRMRSENEAQSQERKPRKNPNRESLASSSEFSMDSPSYGSFTTYEKIHLKQASMDGEVMTPVRRSSRIRKLVTSP